MENKEYESDEIASLRKTDERNQVFYKPIKHSMLSSVRMKRSPS